MQSKISSAPSWSKNKKEKFDLVCSPRTQSVLPTPSATDPTLYTQKRLISDVQRLAKLTLPANEPDFTKCQAIATDPAVTTINNAVDYDTDSLPDDRELFYCILSPTSFAVPELNSKLVDEYEKAAFTGEYHLQRLFELDAGMSIPQKTTMASTVAICIAKVTY